MSFMSRVSDIGDSFLNGLAAVNPAAPKLYRAQCAARATESFGKATDFDLATKVGNFGQRVTDTFSTLQSFTGGPYHQWNTQQYATT